MKQLPTIARGNPLNVSCSISKVSDGTIGDGLTVTAFIGARKNSTAPISDALSVLASERTEDPSTTARPYDAEFTGDVTTNELAAFDDQSVWVIFTVPENAYRQELEYLVVPGQGA